MSIQVLVATMHQEDHSLLEKMNVQSDAIISNQCGKNSIEEFVWRGYRIKYLNFNERGVGLNRNNSLMRAEADICIFADDDVVYVDNYSSLIEGFYEQHPEADVVIFNLLVTRNGKTKNIVKETKRVGRKGLTSFGTFSISIRRNAIRRANIYFHLDFGGGAKFSCGEDTIFLQDCVKKDLIVYTCTETIGFVNHGVSTWFQQFNDKFFYDKGVLFHHISNHLAKAIALYHCLKHRKLYSDYGWVKAYMKMLRGIDDANKDII